MSRDQQRTPNESQQSVLDAINELRCSLSTIAGMARSNGHNALKEIAMTAEVGIARLDLILSYEPQPEDGSPCEYFRARDCLAGCPLVACQEAGSCQKPGVAA